MTNHLQVSRGNRGDKAFTRGLLILGFGVCSILAVWAKFVGPSVLFAPTLGPWKGPVFHLLAVILALAFTWAMLSPKRIIELKGAIARENPINMMIASIVLPVVVYLIAGSAIFRGVPLVSTYFHSAPVTMSVAYTNIRPGNVCIIDTMTRCFGRAAGRHRLIEIPGQPHHLSRVIVERGWTGASGPVPDDISDRTLQIEGYGNALGLRIIKVTSRPASPTD